MNEKKKKNVWKLFGLNLDNLDFNNVLILNNDC